MGNIVRWFEDFPRRALDLLPEMKRLAAEQDRIGTMSLLVAPALIVAPYERLQTYATRRNPQVDYLHFPEPHARFNSVMLAPFEEAKFWTAQAKATVVEWKGSQVPRITREPSDWETATGYKPHQDEFWSVSIPQKETRWVWKLLRDALSHWNVANSDRGHNIFHERGTMERLIFYRSYSDRGPWDVLSVPPEAFSIFLESWTSFLGRGSAHKLLKASEAA
jgi:hypothetical protein